MSNRVFCEKVQPMEGASEVLFAAGFQQQKLKIQEHEEDYLVFDINLIDGIDSLQVKI